MQANRDTSGVRVLHAMCTTSPDLSMTGHHSTTSSGAGKELIRRRNLCDGKRPRPEGDETIEICREWQPKYFHVEE